MDLADQVKLSVMKVMRFGFPSTSTIASIRRRVSGYQTEVRCPVSLMTAYLVILVLFGVPLAARFFAETFFPLEDATRYVVQAGLTSPFSAAFAIPLDVAIELDASSARSGDMWLVTAYAIFTACLNVVLLLAMMWLFHRRWRVAQ